MRSGNRTIVSKLMTLILAVVLMAAYLPTKAIAAGGSIKVFLTVSTGGELAFANDENPMARKEVTVTDLDGDGKYTFDEALKAAHKAYNTESGYDSESGYVKKLWGAYDWNDNFLFCINHKVLPNRIRVDQVPVEKGDYLTASIYSDSELYTDWYTKFDKDVQTVEAGKPFQLTLKGHQAMANNSADKEFVPLKDIDVNAYGMSDPLPTTDANGTVELTIKEPGSYVFTASGVTKGLWEDGSMKNSKHDEKEMPEGVYWKNDDNYNSGVAVAYSKTDYGTDPCPLGEVDWMDWGAWREATQSSESPEFEGGYLLRSNKFIVDAPVVSPACIVTVKTSIEDAKVTAAKTTYSGKQKRPSLNVSIDSTPLKKGVDYSVVYTNNVKAGSGKAVLTGIGRYAGTKEVTFTIAKASQKPIIKGRKYKVPAQTLLETKVKCSIKSLVKTDKTKGKLKYSATIKSSKSKAVLSKKKGIIRIKKKTKKGIYPVYVKVTAAGDNNHKSVTKTVKAYIIVK